MNVGSELGRMDGPDVIGAAVGTYVTDGTAVISKDGVTVDLIVGDLVVFGEGNLVDFAVGDIVDSEVGIEVD